MRLTLINHRDDDADSVGSRHGRPPKQRGFTLIELVMVIVLAGVLAVVAAPKLFSTDDFYARGFHDE